MEMTPLILGEGQRSSQVHQSLKTENYSELHVPQDRKHALYDQVSYQTDAVLSVWLSGEAVLVHQVLIAGDSVGTLQ